MFPRNLTPLNHLFRYSRFVNQGKFRRFGSGIELVSDSRVHKSEEDPAAITALLAIGDLKTHVSKTFPLDEMAEAHAFIQTKNAVGKIIVIV